jgi:branched-chain amino acid transport system substrate-binding protein
MRLVMIRYTALLAAVLASVSVQAAEPIRIGITTILSGPTADRGQSEQYGAQLAINQINEAGGILGRPIEAFYADNACKPDVGVPATKRLLEQAKVPVVIGALCTPVTHAIMPVMQEAKVPLLIATSAGQDFVDASGAGGNAYAFKTIPSEVDIARGLIHYLSGKGIKSVAVVTDTGGFPEANAIAFAAAARAAGMTVTGQVVIPPNTSDFAPLIDKLKAGQPQVLLAMPGSATSGFFKAYEASGWKVPISGRLDIGAALGAVSPAFREAGGLADLTSIAVFTPLITKPQVHAFVQSYQAHYGLMPTQRSFFVYEAVLLAADAIRHAGSDEPAAIEAALKSTTMASALGGTYAMDDHNHPKLPLFITGLKDGKPAIIAED